MNNSPEQSHIGLSQEPLNSLDRPIPQNTFSFAHKFRQGRVKLLISASILLVSVPVALAALHNRSQLATTNQSNLATVHSSAVTIRIGASGTVIPEREVKISPKQAGLLKKLMVQQGDYVKAGQLIAVMDNSNIRGQVEGAEGAYYAAWQSYLRTKNGNRPQEIAQSRAQYQKAQSALASARFYIEKIKAQIKSQQATVRKDEEFALRQSVLSDEGAISKQEYLNAQTQAEVSKQQLEVLQQDLAQANEALMQSQSDLSQKKSQLELTEAGYREEEIESARQSAAQQRGNMNYLRSLESDTQIRAPFDGQITQKYAEEGSFVTPSAAAATSSATSSSIVVLSGKLEIVAQVPESAIERIKVGQNVEITATAISKKTFHGVVSQIAPAAITSSNVTVFEVHVKLNQEATEHLKSGMNVSTDFLCGIEEDALTIPAVCVASHDGKRGVFIVGKDNMPKFKPVEFGAYLGSEIVVSKGLSNNQKIFRGLSDSQIKENGFSASIKPPMGGK